MKKHKMLKYYYPDNQTMRVTGGEIPFFNWMSELYSSFVAMFALVVLFPLILVMSSSWLKDYSLCVFLVFVFVLGFIFDKASNTIFRPVVSINRSGRITIRSNLDADHTFEKGDYKFLVEKKHHEVYEVGEDTIWDEYRMSLVNGNDRRFTLFVVTGPDEIDKFEKTFSGYTSFTPKIEHWHESFSCGR